jgi:hypothetical protein
MAQASKHEVWLPVGFFWQDVELVSINFKDKEKSGFSWKRMMEKFAQDTSQVQPRLRECQRRGLRALWV